jgi:hypothetical protein
MAIEPQNLIQIQSSLQDPLLVKNEDLIKYANGSNPEVPPFLALIEMNRRKQIEEGSTALDTTKGTIKDQVAGSLAAPPTGINPTANPYTVNPAAAPTNANPTGNPFGMGITQLPQGVNPTQAPPMQKPSPNQPVMAAEGGLMSLPVSHFNENSYAGGGIVAFGDPTLNPDEQQLVSFPQERANKRVLTDAQIAQELAKSQAAFVVPAAPAPKPGSYESILAGLPPAPEITAAAPEPINRAQAYEGIKESQRLAGVSADPYAEANKRQAAKEKREQEVYERGGIDRLIAQASAFAKADPARGIGYQSAVAADASQVLQKEQDIIRDKQEAAAIEFHKSLAKEEDAKRRGDAAGIESAVSAREKAQMDFEKLRFDAAKVQNDRGLLASHIFNTKETAATQRAANANTASYQQGMLEYHKKMAKLAEDQKPTAEDKKLLKVQSIVNAHPAVKAISDAIKQGTIEQGTPEYYAALRRINEIAKPLYESAGLEPPEEVQGEVTASPTKKPSLWDRIFGESPKAVTSAPVGSNAPAAPPPPEVQKILDKYK